MKISNTLCTAYDPAVIVNKSATCAKDTVCISYVNTREALSDLSPVAFSLYMFFALFGDKWFCDFAGGRFCNLTGLSYNSFIDAYNELLAANYLTLGEKGADTLNFYDTPNNPPFLPQINTSSYEVHDESENIW